MVNKAVLKKKAAPTDTVNDAGGPAYRLAPQEALAQLALTGCLNGTYYQTADKQLDELKRLCELNGPEYIAKLAVYARQSGYMKDTPAFLLAVLHNHGSNKLLKTVFPLVIDNGKMLRNFVQIVRSGTLGRKSFGTATKRLIRNWLEGRTDRQLFWDSVGQSPSLADIIKMVHPRPLTPEREALYGYLIGKDVKELPDIVADWERFKNGVSEEIPTVPFQMLTSLQGDRARAIWKDIAKKAAWTMTRMNLNNFEKYGVLEDRKMVKLIADRLADPGEIKQARPFPYQLLMTYTAYQGSHRSIKDALHDAMETAVSNVPAIDGKVLIAVDTSGSMQSAVTGQRKGATTRMSCVQVAALIAAAITRRNRDAEVVLFDTSAIETDIEPRDTVMTNAQKLNRHGGGTDCSAAFQLWNKKGKKADAVVMVSDNESWFSVNNGGRWHGVRGSDTMKEWLDFKSRNRKARLVCIDLTPNTTTQANTQPDILNVGGFGDQVFNVMADFLNGKTNSMADVVKAVNFEDGSTIPEPEPEEQED